MDVLDLIASDNYITLNKTLLKKLGVEATILFGALCSYQRYFNGEEFYKEQDKLIEDTCLTEYLLRNATKILKDLGLISVIKKGLPAKNYYKVNADKLLELLTTSGAKFDTTGDIKNDTTGSVKIDTTYNKNTTNKNTLNKNKDNIYIETKETKHKYGEYKHVLLTDKQYQKLTNDYGENQTLSAIKYLDEYIQMKGYKCQDHNLAMRKWVFEAINKNKKQKTMDILQELHDEAEENTRSFLWN